MFYQYFGVRKCSTNSFLAVEQSIPCVEICSISILELESVLQFFSFRIRLSHFFLEKWLNRALKFWYLMENMDASMKACVFK